MGEFFVGLDLGQARDPSAIVVLERLAVAPPAPTEAASRKRFLLDEGGGPIGTSARQNEPKTEYHARHIQRIRLGTPYPEVVRTVRELLDRIGEPLTLIADATGVGRAVIDLFEAARVYPIAVTLTAGESVVRVEHGYRVPKRDLVCAVEVLLQERRLKIAKEASGATALVDELLSFRVHTSASGHDKYAAGGRAHDDLVIALALAAWQARSSESFRPLSLCRGASEPVDDDEERHAACDDAPRECSLFEWHRGSGRHVSGGSAGVPAPRHLRSRWM